MSSHGLFSVHAQRLLVSFLIRTPDLSNQGPTLLTSFDLNYLLKGLSNIVMGVRAPTHEGGRGDTTGAKWEMKKRTTRSEGQKWGWSNRQDPDQAMGFPGGSDGKESACNAGDVGSIPGLGRSPGEKSGYPLQYFCLENPMHRGA